MTTTLPLAATSISFLYVEAEDRLAFVVTAASDRLALLVTRRLASRLVNGLAGLLERTSAAALEAPAQARGDVVMFEHQGAVAAAQAAAETSAAAPTGGETPVSGDVASVLIDSVDVTTHPDRFALVLKKGPQALATMEVGRADLHRIVAVLRRKCEEAEWRVPIETTWLDVATGSMTLN